MQLATQVVEHRMVVGAKIMHQLLNEGYVGHALIRVDNESEPDLEPIHILLQYFLEELNNFKETIGLLRLMDLHVSLRGST